MTTTTNTLASMATLRSEPRELCSYCDSQPYDLICTCGDKFDFNCIHQHVEQISCEFQEHYEQVSRKMVKLNDLPQTGNNNFDAVRTGIENWRQRRLQDVNDTADKALNEIAERQNGSTDISLIRDTFEKLSSELHRMVHENLSLLVELHREVQNKISGEQSLPEITYDDASLDALMQGKLTQTLLNTSAPPSSTNINNYDSSTNLNNQSSSANVHNHDSSTGLNHRSSSASVHGHDSSTNLNNRSSSANVHNHDFSTGQNNRSSSASVHNHDFSTSLNNRSSSSDTNHQSSLADTNNQNSSADTNHRSSTTNLINRSSSADTNNRSSITNDVEPVAALVVPPTTPDASTIKSPQPTVELTNSTDTTEIPTTEHGNNDEFDAGVTGRIQRVNPILVPTSTDQFAGIVCCHGNQLIYNDMDKTTRSYRLTFIPDVSAPTTKISIDWTESDSNDQNDDEWIQDIVYSEKCAGYLILNRARLCLYNPVTKVLDEFVTFNNRTMKRLSSSDKYIYLVSNVATDAYNGDEITLMNYDKEEKLNKTFRDVIPSRINRGAGASVGQISDIAVGTNEQVTLGYRLERRHEVGVCVFNVSNDGREWSCVKQLLLNECWHNDLSYTPRIEWCQKLNVFILIEYMTGHLIMIGRDGQVEGECRFMHAENRRESPINLSISPSDWFCVRYESSINILKIT